MTDIPYNKEAEEATIGGVLINPDLFPEISQFLSAEDFYIHRHRFIWQALLVLQANKTPVDFLTVSSQLRDMKVLEEIGGESYLTCLLAQVPTSLHAVAYAKMIVADSDRRKLLVVANTIATLAYDTTKTVEEIQADSSSAFQEAVSRVKVGDKSMKELALDHSNYIKKNNRESDANLGVKFKLTAVDSKLGFGLKKLYMMVAGRPGVGKSSFAIQFAIQAARQHKTVAIFSLEMSGEMLMNVIISILTGIDSQKLEAGRLSDEEWAIYEKAQTELVSLEDYLFIEICNGTTIQQIRSRCLVIKAKQGALDLVIVDYLLLMDDYHKLDVNDRANNISRDFAKLRKELKCALIVIHHMNRSFEHRQDGIPILADLTEGGEQAPDIVFFLTINKDAIPIRGKIPAKGSFVKHRNGPVGPVELSFNRPCTTFEDAPRNYLR